MATKMTPEQVTTGLRDVPSWSGDGDKSLKRTFKFKDHIAAMGFVVRVAMAAEVMDHHPDLHIVYNTVDIVLNSHDAGGVTDRDFALAKKIDEYA
ncbi:MAG: 4a-hydroxytetrahydrobiopterin dehydratase [Tepidiformaceae bacterium]